MTSSRAWTTTLPTRRARTASPLAFRAIQLITPRPMRVAPTSRARTFVDAGVARPNPASIDSGDTNSASPKTTAAMPPIMRARRGVTARRVGQGSSLRLRAEGPALRHPQLPHAGLRRDRARMAMGGAARLRPGLDSGDVDDVQSFVSGAVDDSFGARTRDQHLAARYLGRPARAAAPNAVGWACAPRGPSLEGSGRARDRRGRRTDGHWHLRDGAVVSR